MTAELMTLQVRGRRQWRAWLAKHHTSSPGVWLVFYKAHTGVSRSATKTPFVRRLASDGSTLSSNVSMTTDTPICSRTIVCCCREPVDQRARPQVVAGHKVGAR